MSRKKVAIVGAGPTGLTTALLLSNAGIAVDIYDAGNTVGGLSASFRKWGKTVELGPHFFDILAFPRVKSIIYDAYADEFELYQRNTRILLNNSLFRYPPNPLDIVANIGLMPSIRLSLSLAKAKLGRKRTASTAEELSINCTGQFIHDMFIRDYARKLWGLDSDKLSPRFLTELVGYSARGFPVSSILRRLFVRKAHLYAHPTHGLSNIWEKIAELIMSRNGSIYMSRRIREVQIDDQDIARGIELDSGEIRQYDHTVLTIPRKDLSRLLKIHSQKIELASAPISYRSLVAVYLNVLGDSPFPEQCVFLYSANTRALKVTNFSSFPRRNESTGSHVVLFEYWCEYDDELWNQDDAQILHTVKTDIGSLSTVLSNVNIAEIEVRKIKDVYPVPDIAYYDQITEVDNIVSGIDGLSYAGRGANASFNYSTVAAVGDAIDLSENLIQRFRD